MTKKLSYWTRFGNYRNEQAAAAELLGGLKLRSKAWVFASRRYRYIEGGVNGKGQAVWFCWMCKADAEGNWWTWREVHTARSLKRYQMTAKRTRTAAYNLAVTRQHAFIDSIEKEQT